MLAVQYAFLRFNSLQEDYICNQKCAPQHQSNRDLNVSNKTHLNISIESGRSVAWPPYDPLQFFPSHIKLKLCSIPINSIEKLKRKIRTEVCSIDKETLNNAWYNFKLRVNSIRKPQRGHIQSLVKQ